MLTLKINPSFYLALLFLEIFGLTGFYDLPSSYPAYPDDVFTWLLAGSKDYWQIALWIIGFLLFFIAPKHQHIVTSWKAISHGHNHNKWLLSHLMAFTGFALFTGYFFDQLNNSTQPSYLCLLLWLFLAASTFGLWLFSFAPGKFWLWLVKNLRLEILAGIAAGLCAWLLVGVLNRQEAPLGQKALWVILSGLTLEIVYKILGWFYSRLIYDPDSLVVGTEEFPLEVSYACSGIEGVSLIILFLSLYLWLFRKELRFPHAFWLYPLGIVTIWLANSIRIFLLIAAGTSYSKEIASKALHAQAGWIVFTLVSLGAITLSHQSRLFGRKDISQIKNQKNNRQAAALLIPFLVQLALTMAASAFSAGFDRFYPFKIIVLAAALCYFWKFYKTLSWSWSWQSLAIGAGVFVFWILLEQDSHDKGVLLAKNISGLPDFTAILWITFRILGSSIVIPIVEELAFRGYLMRKLIADDFENVSIGQFSLWSFLVSSLLFGLLHDRWFAGMLAGMGYAGALYRRKQLADAITAHMSTNFLIAGYVLIARKWSLWA